MTAPKPRDQLKKVRWSAEEDDLLRQLWPSADLPEILAALPGRSARACGRRAYDLGVRCVNRRHLNKVASPVIARDGVEGKACVKCLEWKPLGKFSRHSTSAGGRRNICTTCEGRIAYKANPERCKAAVRTYQKRHPEETKRHAINSQARWRGRKKSQGRGVTLAELESLRQLYGGCCAYCGGDADSIDHVMPLSRGGPHEIENLVPACRSCNSSKKDKTPEEWSARRNR